MDFPDAVVSPLASFDGICYPIQKALYLMYETIENSTPLVWNIVPDVGIKEQKAHISYADPRVFAAESFPPCETEFLEQESEVKCVNYPIP